MKREWVPTQRELDGCAEAMAFVGLRAFMLPLLLLTVSACLFAWGGRLAVGAIPILAAVSGLWVFFCILRRARRVLERSYPVGQVATMEALDSSLRLANAVEIIEIPWHRLVRPRVRSRVVVLRDTVLPRTVTLPRQLVADEWLPWFGTPGPAASVTEGTGLPGSA